MVLLVLAVVWAAVLIPPAIRARAEGRPGDSISNFHRQLTVLRGTGPHQRSPSGGRGAGGDHWYRPNGSSPALIPVHGPLRSTRAATIAARRAPVRGMGTSSAASAARSRTIRRRRDVLLALFTAAAATLALGLLFSIGLMLIVHVVADVLLVAYVALLARRRSVATERDMKVRFLPQAHRLDPALLRAEPALLRRSAN